MVWQGAANKFRNLNFTGVPESPFIHPAESSSISEKFYANIDMINHYNLLWIVVFSDIPVYLFDFDIRHVPVVIARILRCCVWI